jgi:hypothetical protein
MPPIDRPILPDLPKGEWSDRTRALWEAWQYDWATGWFGSSEIGMALELAALHNEAVNDPKKVTQRWTEVRQWMDRLGLSPKGKRDLRLRLAEKVEEAPARKHRKSGLHLVDDAVSA